VSAVIDQVLLSAKIGLFGMNLRKNGRFYRKVGGVGVDEEIPDRKKPILKWLVEVATALKYDFSGSSGEYNLS
jgi:hypothetical protein